MSSAIDTWSDSQGGPARAGTTYAGHPGGDGLATLRIALVVPPYFDVPPEGYGGVEAVVADLADALVNRGHRVTLIGAGRPGTMARFLPVWDRTVPERLGEPLPEATHAALTRRAVLDLARTERLDVVHEHTIAGPLNAAVYGAYGLTTVATVHGPVGGDLRTFYETLGADLALVAISERQRALAPGLNWVATVHNALDPQAWPFQESKGDYALFLGRYHPDKGPHLALEAAHAAGVPLILAGKCAEPIEKEYYERAVLPRLGPTDQVLGVADAQTKRRLLAGARCLLFPVQWEEPFGMVMIEAMACGTPIVALRAGAVPEVVVDGVTGIICDEPGQLPLALRYVTGIAPAACRSHVTRHFATDRLGAGYEAAYRAAIAHCGVEAPGHALSTLRMGLHELDAALERQHTYTAGTASGHRGPAGVPRRGQRLPVASALIRRSPTNGQRRRLESR